jgi:hypothetical protein
VVVSIPIILLICDLASKGIAFRQRPALCTSRNTRDILRLILLLSKFGGSVALRKRGRN